MRWTKAQAIQVFLLIAASVAVTWNAWFDLFRIAMKDEESSHIFLVPIVAGWLVWVRRERLRNLAVKPTFFGPAIMLIGWACYSFGDLLLLQAVWHFGALLLAIGCFISIAGRRVILRFFPAFAVLIFMIPVPGMVRQQIAQPLQTATALATEEVLMVIGVQVERFGNLLTINGQDVAVAEACNGLRMVFALVLVSYAFAFGTPIKGFVRMLVLFASPISAILCNVIRLVPTVWVYGNYSETTAEAVHDASGWIMLPVAFLILMGIIRVLRWAQVPVYRFQLAYGD